VCPQVQDLPESGHDSNGRPVNRVRALEQIRRMRGGSQSHLMRCSDGFYYVVKFQNNPQHRRILVGELLGTALAERLGLPTPGFAIVDVDDALINSTPELCIELPLRRKPCKPGLHFGSRFPVDPRRAALFDFLPDSLLLETENLQDFVGMLVFDKWTCNTDWRQVVFSQSSKASGYRAWMIDQGFCFNEGDWNFSDAPKRSLFRPASVYEQVTGIESFGPWLSKLDSEIGPAVLREIADTIPHEWYSYESAALNSLLEKLDARRSKVRMLLEEVHRLYDSPFPNWPRQSTNPALRSASARAVA
jgi:hypothetical protein